MNKILVVFLFSAIAVSAQYTDSYEPNNDFSSAYLISAGDSAVKNAVVFGLAPLDASVDTDYYKITLDSGKVFTFSPIFTEAQCQDTTTPALKIGLYDSNKLLLNTAYVYKCQSSFNCFLKKSGTYYLMITNDKIGQEILQYSLSIQQQDLKDLISIVSPNGGETFSAGQMVEINSLANPLLGSFKMHYSIDNGVSWRVAWMEPTPSPSEYIRTEVTRYFWKVPHLTHGTDRALFKVIPNSIKTNDISIFQYGTEPITNIYDISNGTFTILASASDVYEPNDNFLSAREISLGDSVVKNAIVTKSILNPDSSGFDSSLTDVDIFKVYLTAGKVVTISDVSFGFWNENIFRDMVMGPVTIRLYDVSKNEIAANLKSLTCKISQSGFYYCEISSDNRLITGTIIGDDYWNEYTLSIHECDPITIISPNGGENYQTGQKVIVSWLADSLLGDLLTTYSLNNGTSWREIDCYKSGDGSYWTIMPSLSERTDKALFKVSTRETGLFDISNETFTIQAAPMDAYEPNNDISSAYPVAVGDSVVKNASTCRYADLNDSLDYDYYKVNLTAGSLVEIRMGFSGTQDIYPLPAIKLLFGNYSDFSAIPGSKTDYSHYNSNASYEITESGVYYIKVYAQYGSWEKYGLSINSTPTLISETSWIDSTQYDWLSGVYKSTLITDSTKLTIDFTLNKSYFTNRVTTFVLTPQGLAPLPDEKAKVKSIAIFHSYRDNGIISTDITIPYKPSDLSGYPEKALAVVCRTDSTNGLWIPVPSMIDTIKHLITLHTKLTHANLFQVYVKSDGSPVSQLVNARASYGIRTYFHSKNHSINVHFSLPGAVKADLRLYDMQGRCVRTGNFAAEMGSSNHQWNPKGLVNGKYILKIRAGSYHSNESLLLIN